jgi:hypothetical protein
VVVVVTFISTSFAQRHGMRMSTLVTKQIVQLADGSEYEVRRQVLNASVKWEGWNGIVDFLVLPLKQYDAILGMTWLKSYNPHIDWSTGTCVA